MTGSRLAHEQLNQDQPELRSSERSFGLVFTGFCTLVGLWRWGHGTGGWPWWLAAAAVFLVLALAAPGVLAPLNRLWFKFGLALHAVVSPLIMGLLFFCTVTPIALIMRALGKDPLRLRPDPAADSYWLVRDPPGPEPESMRRQF